MKRYIKYLMILVVFFMILSVQAKEVEHFTSKVNNDVVMENTYNSSVAAAGESVSFDGTIKGISIGAGNKVVQGGNSDYALLAGNSIEVNGIINNDAIIAGNIVTIKDTAKISRDMIIAASDVEISGVIDRNISIYASKVTIRDADIKGNVKLYVNKIDILKDAKISGTLSYPEDSSYNVQKGALIGKTIKTDAIQTENDENFFATVSAKIWSFLCLSLVFAVISLIFPSAFSKINNKFEDMQFGEVIEVFTKGLVTLIIVPVVAVFACFTIIGIPLGIITLLLYGIAMYLTTIFTAYLLGYKIWQKVFSKDAHVLLLGLFGLFILFIFSLIPGVRTLVSIITVLIGLGLLIDVIRPKND